ncbi:TIR domain-containing protein [Nostoc sp. C057]|uniref:leucine-rich repeat domain-containing protein n=1 Tax=Nostoc sp. C057 TaxID=2576903 RepID=UPI0015C2CD8F|nr:leucine-rich repeat domain-containing protein [Nostoc sp. C057]QLE48966.1 TIR domain-containing protein [Nostoc sp. C057]
MTNEELLQIIEKAVRGKVTELDLSLKGLTSLPPEIGQLANLQTLYLYNNQLSSLPPEIGQLTNLQTLYLYSNQLSSLPPEIVQLTNLQTLYLGSNQLSSLPPEIGQLTNLQILYLYNNQLSSLPPEIGQLTNLQTLYLYNNQLSSLPPEIGQLTNLQTLYLYNNQLSSLPPEIGQLTNLQTLYLSSNQLSSLPPEIVQLTNLQSLNLSSNQLSSLPPEIGQLTNLQTLYLSSNQLSSLPPEIVQLTNLQTLYLYNNQLSSLPPEIVQLTNLQSLYLYNNQLSSLSPEIGQLTNLQTLYLSSNQLSNLPPEIGQLTNLQTLYLSSNQLSNLPPEIGQLTNLQTLHLENNPLESPPPEIITKGFKAILDFCRQQLEQETDRLYEAKLLIIGEGGAGKTTLAKKIQDNKYTLQQDENTTVGIDVIQWKFLLDNNREFQVNIWDFGGQEIYHATHQFFLTKRSLYALVADTRKEDTDFYYWLNVVELLSGNSPLLIVKNEKQERKREINERELRREFTNFKETLTTNLATDRGLSEILNKIKHYITNLPHVGIELPKTWVKVREALEGDSREYISLEEYMNICQKHGFTKQEDKLQLSGYLHDLGVCLHFQDDDFLIKTVILKPTWGTDAAYKVLDNPQVIEKLGQFERNDLANIWHEDKYADMRPELLRLMMKFKLSYEIPSRPGTYIAPQLLSVNQPDFNWDESNNLILRYKYDFMPKGILTRFIVEMHSDIEQQTLVWKTGVVLAKYESRAEVIEYYNQREIQVRVAGKRKKELLVVINNELEKIHKSYERLQYQTLVPCNCKSCNDSQSPHFYNRDVLYKFRDNNRYQIQCQDSGDMVDVRRLIDDVLPTQPNLEIPMSEPVIRNQVFISYSHQDQEWLTKLQKHLKPMIRNQKLLVWDDTKIQPGAKWREEIENALTAAKVAVLLVSPDFLASDFIADNELPPLLDAAEAKGLTIIWIPLSSSGYDETEIEKYQSAHPPNQPLDSLNSAQENKAWVDICKKIKAAVLG